ncbi:MULTISPECIES: hypothetical protein [Chryseobacterium]|uniref:hypothetical protein n=1 Tax=Chryseobacterium TaxID=59732 RepID=UPI000A90B7DA|nr:MULTISPECIES: hypothetical protein [Chryseobacterium]
MLEPEIVYLKSIHVYYQSIQTYYNNNEIEGLPENMHWITDPAGTVFNLQQTSS